MSEKRFIVENDNNEVSIKDKVEDNYPFALAYEHIDDADNLIQECLSLVGLLNEQQSTIEHLRKQIQIYEQLISNSYVGEEETLDGFVGKYVIWENELQKYKEKIKGVFNE